MEDDGDDGLGRWRVKQDVHETVQVSSKSKIQNVFHVFPRYITGSNKKDEKIKMTVPVRMLLEKEMKNKQMCFYIPKTHQQNPPQPLDNSVYIEKTPQMTVFVHRFGGSVGNLKTIPLYPSITDTR